MYVRLAFAVAAHLELDTLLVDEVLAVGDLDFQKKVLAKMGTIAKAGGRSCSSRTTSARSTDCATARFSSAAGPSTATAPPRT